MIQKSCSCSSDTYLFLGEFELFVKLPVENGSRIHVINRCHFVSESPIEIAASHEDIVDYLIEKGGIEPKIRKKNNCSYEEHLFDDPADSGSSSEYEEWND